MTLRAKVVAVLVGGGLLGSCLFAGFIYRKAVAGTEREGREKGLALVARTVETFMVSTRRFDQAFNSASTPEEKKRLLDDWNRTIEAVDTAVIHDFGEGQPRIRLIGDKDLVGYKPLGGPAIAVSRSSSATQSGDSRPVTLPMRCRMARRFVSRCHYGATLTGAAAIAMWPSWRA